MTLISAVATRLQFERPPTIRMISTTRSFVQDLYGPVIGFDNAARLAMVTHELMENLAKYAKTGPVELEIGFGDGSAQRDVRISTTNAVEASQLPELEELLAEVAQSSDPRAMFQSFINRSVQRETGSRLGLARIRAEAGMQLYWEVNETTVVIRAETRLSLEGPDGQ
jgi:hypothetical protein